jgi:crotonobetainyl-CoA:carnitine CoA-transferase CaiB-like acyl-CoA transferase
MTHGREAFKAFSVPHPTVCLHISLIHTNLWPEDKLSEASKSSDRPRTTPLRVLDFGTGMAPALVTRYFVEIAAEVIRFEPRSGDPFYRTYPAYEIWHRGKIKKRSEDLSEEELAHWMSTADVCVLGGEDFPGLSRYGDPDQLVKRNPRLVVLSITAYPGAMSRPDRAAAEVLVQAKSGLCYEHYTDRPLRMSFEPCNYGAGLQGLTGVLAALYDRERSGLGQVVRTSLFEGALTYGCSFWSEASKPSAAFEFCVPKDPWPLIFKCRDGRYVHIIMGTAGSKGKLYGILGIDDPTVDMNDSGVPSLATVRLDMKKFFGDVELIAPFIQKRESEELLGALWDAGLAADLVQPPGACWDDPQVLHNGIIRRDSDGTRFVSGNPVSVAPSPAPSAALPPAGARPLSGLRVVDFGTFVAGPYTSAILGDLGADVIKVEALAKDPNRNVFRSFTTGNRGKRAIMLDLKTAEGRDIAQRLCVKAEVVTNNFRTGVAERLGIDARTLHRMKPELIVLESAAYGATGPKSQRAGFDLAFQAFCGHEYRAGGTGNAPLWNRSTLVDYTGGLLGAIAVLQALQVRAQTGAGSELNMPLLNAGVFLLSELVQRPDGAFVGAPSLNREQTGFHPLEQMYQTADGWIAIAVRDPESANALVTALELGASVQGDLHAWGESAARSIAAAIRGRSTRDLLELLKSAGIWTEECARDAAHRTLNDEGLIAAGTVHVSQHAQFGTVREIGQLFRFSRSASGTHGHTAQPGEHTRAVLAELGYAAEAVADLYERKIAA